MGGTCSSNGDGRGAYRFLVGETGGKKTTWKNQGHKWENNIKINIREVGMG